MTSASKTFTPAAEVEAPVVDMAELATRLAARREALGEPLDLPRNSGNRRTASKRALLKAIDAVGGKW